MRWGYNDITGSQEHEIWRRNITREKENHESFQGWTGSKWTNERASELTTEDQNKGKKTWNKTRKESISWEKWRNITRKTGKSDIHDSELDTKHKGNRVPEWYPRERADRLPPLLAVVLPVTVPTPTKLNNVIAKHFRLLKTYLDLDQSAYHEHSPCEHTRNDILPC